MPVHLVPFQSTSAHGWVGVRPQIDLRAAALLVCVPRNSSESGLPAVRPVVMLDRLPRGHASLVADELSSRGIRIDGSLLADVARRARLELLDGVVVYDEFGAPMMRWDDAPAELALGRPLWQVHSAADFAAAVWRVLNPRQLVTDAPPAVLGGPQAAPGVR